MDVLKNTIIHELQAIIN